MPRIHSWREVIAPRDCRCIVHRVTLHPAAGFSTGTIGTSSSLEPPSSPTRFPPPLTPSPFRRTSNEQFHYCLTPVINLHGRPLALPSLLPPSSYDLFHPLPCRDSLPCFSPSSPPKTPPSLVRLCVFSLTFSISFHYVSFAFILRISYIPFSFYFVSLSTVLARLQTREKRREERAECPFRTFYITV